MLKLDANMVEYQHVLQHIGTGSTTNLNS